MKNLWQLLFACSLLMAVVAYPPYDSWNVYKSIQLNSCTAVKDVEELCQRCAIFTKSQNVYPMCCTNTDEVQTWCRKAIEYGYQENVNK